MIESKKSPKQIDNYIFSAIIPHLNDKTIIKMLKESYKRGREDYRNECGEKLKDMFNL